MKKGFTLIELLAVVLIMGILTAVALPQYRKSVDRARVAEALQMLPAIYDARDRLITENSATGLNDTSDVTFARLDVELKGKEGSSSQVWDTENCTYALTPRLATVSASLTSGKYKGTTLYYNGSNVTCCGGTDVCDTLNINPSNSCRTLLQFTPIKAEWASKWDLSHSVAVDSALIYRKVQP